MEWTWCSEDVETDDFNTNYMNKYRSQVLKNILYFGAIIAAGPAAFFASLFGFKAVLAIGLVITVCGSFAIIFHSTGTILALYIGRIMHGMGAGIVFVVVPNYAVEIADPKIRGEYYKKYICKKKKNTFFLTIAKFVIYI